VFKAAAGTAPPADLVVSTLKAAANTAAGSALPVTDTVRNAGAAPAPATVTRLYLSLNKTIDDDDVLLGERHVPPLGADANSKGSVTVTIPSHTTTGGYFLLARADGLDVALESSESNNARAKALRVGPDLVVSKLVASGVAQPGIGIVVTDTTRSQPGAAPSGASTTRFYLSTNRSYDAGDVPLGARTVPSLIGGASSAASTVLTVPAGTAPGAYHLVARADAFDVVVEASETNNTRTLALTVVP
jgi:subtilase family serine protease